MISQQAANESAEYKKNQAFLLAMLGQAEGAFKAFKEYSNYLFGEDEVKEISEDKIRKLHEETNRELTVHLPSQKGR